MRLCSDGGKVDLTRPFLRQGLGFVVAVLLDKKKSVGFVAAVNHKLGLFIAYCFKRSDFPWVAIWEENLGIAAPPWKQRTRARGLEFSTTPLPVLRRDAFLSGRLFDEPTLTCVPAMGTRLFTIWRCSREFQMVSAMSSTSILRTIKW